MATTKRDLHQPLLHALRGAHDACAAYRPGGRDAHGHLHVTFLFLPTLLTIFADRLAGRAGALARVPRVQGLPKRCACGVNSPAHVAAWSRLGDAVSAALTLEETHPEAESVAWLLDMLRSVLEGELHFCKAVCERHLQDGEFETVPIDKPLDLAKLARASRPLTAA